MAEPDGRTDEQLVAACNAGDAAAFGAIYARYRDWAVRVAFRFTGDRDEALDVMQESFIYLLSRFPGFRLTARLTSFLYIVIKHNALSGKRKRKRWTVGEVVERVVEGGEGGGVAGVGGEVSGMLRGVVEQLPDTHREVLLMAVVDGMSMQEIGAALSIPVGTVKSRLHHAVAALRADPRTSRYFAGEFGV